MLYEVFVLQTNWGLHSTIAAHMFLPLVVSDLILGAPKSVSLFVAATVLIRTMDRGLIMSIEPVL